MSYQRKVPKFSIIIPSWFTKGQDGRYGTNETFYIACQCLEKMIERTPRENYELIMVDNGSTINLDKEIVFTDNKNYSNLLGNPKWYFEQADVLIRNKTNLGFAIACNQGFNVARGEYILCLNNDILVWKNWLEELIKPFSMSLEPLPKAGVVMPALMKEKSKIRKNKEGKAESVNFFEALEIENIDLKCNAGKYGAGAEFGSCWIMSREVMNKIKGLNNGLVFDENFRMGFGEDRLLWEQVRELGYETYRTHDTRVFHVGNVTISKLEDRKQYTASNRIYLEKLRNNKDKKLTDREKDILREESQKEYEQSLEK